MCRRCHAPPAVPPPKAECSRCSNYGTCWTIHRRLVPPDVPWPRWEAEHICYACIAIVILAV